MQSLEMTLTLGERVTLKKTHPSLSQKRVMRSLIAMDGSLILMVSHSTVSAPLILNHPIVTEVEVDHHYRGQWEGEGQGEGQGEGEEDKNEAGDSEAAGEAAYRKVKEKQSLPTAAWGKLQKRSNSSP